MKKFPCTLIALTAAALSLAGVDAVVAQQKRASPHETINMRVDKKLVTITYGRPDAKGRKIWGGLVPFGKAWRMGADEATTLLTEQAIKIGGADVPAGAYTLYLIPDEKGTSKLAISKTIGKWGIPVDEKNDLARVDVKRDEIEKQVDQFTMALDMGTTGGVIKMTWEKLQFSVPISSK